jgi:hypothetical protein
MEVRLRRRRHTARKARAAIRAMPPMAAATPMPALAPVLREDDLAATAGNPEVEAAAGEALVVELEDWEDDVVVSLEVELEELKELDDVNDVVDITAVGGFDVVLGGFDVVVVVALMLVVVGDGDGVVIFVVVVVVGVGVLVSTVPKVKPVNRLMVSPVAAGRTS